MGRWDEQLKKYDALVSQTPEIERKGKSGPYTSSQGHMFSFLNKDGDFGMRFSKPVQEKYMAEWNSDYLRSHGAKLNGYVMIPDSMWDDTEKMIGLMRESLAYVNSLEPK